MPKKLVIIAQNEYGSVKNSDSIMTYGINTCCALVVYNRQKTFLAHIDAFTDLSFITTMVADEFKGEKPKIFLFHRNGNVYPKVIAELKRLGMQFTLRMLDQDKPNLMITNMAISYPDRVLVNTALNNEHGIPDFLGFKSSEIETNGESFFERVKYNHHVILSCMFLEQERPIVRVCTDSVLTQQKIPLEGQAKVLVDFNNVHGQQALTSRLLTKREFNWRNGYTAEFVSNKIDNYAFLCSQMNRLPSNSPISTTSLTTAGSNIHTCDTKTAVIIGMVAILALALSCYNQATQVISR